MISTLLQPGACIAVLAPGGPVPADRLGEGLSVLFDWGLRVVEFPHLRGRHADLPHLAGTDQDRAADFLAAWRDPAVAAVIAGRGGTGVQRLLARLEPDQLRLPRPKVLIGFSDLTPLLHLATRTGHHAIHGPVVTSLGAGDDASRTHLRQLLLGTEPEPLWQRMRLLIPGGVDAEPTGPLSGGNLTVLQASLGRPELNPAAGCIVVLEDIGERPFRLDRTLTSVLRSGWLDGAAAIVLGDFCDCGDADLVQRVLLDRLAGLGVPVWAGAPVGHGARNLAFPLGRVARLRRDGSLTLTRPGP